MSGEAQSVQEEAARVAPLTGVCGPQGTPEQVGDLFRALATAMSAAGVVRKDGRNDYHRYEYATAGAIFGRSQSALAAAGVSVVPLDLWERDKQVGRRYCIGHSSGAWMVVAASNWPVVMGKGQTADKAHAAALTGSHRYFLRDLLQIADNDSSVEFNARDDSEPQRQQARQQQPKPKPKQQQPKQQQQKEPAPWPPVDSSTGRSLNFDKRRGGGGWPQRGQR